MNYRSIKGTKDILPSESSQWQFVEQTMRDVFHRFNYKEIRTPIFESTGLFARSIGELTDIVGKEMYTFEDRSKDSITLRPEATASVMRSFIQNNLGESQPLTKVYYIGPMFRQERPQAGRLRQFHQFGAEAIGSPTAETDVEIIAMAIEIYKALGITNYSLQINSVGDEECRPRYKEILSKELRTIADKLSFESQKRIDQNPMRVLDSKDENDKLLTASMPLITDYLNEECTNHFERVKALLTACGIPFTVNSRLVRGLDYYTKTAFEITSTELGSQDALAGGGRYDLLVKELGGKQTPGVGFAAGIERLMTILEKNNLLPASKINPLVFIAAADNNSREWTFLKTQELRKENIAAETDLLNRSLKTQLKEAERQNAEFALVVGQEEIKKGEVFLKGIKSSISFAIELNKVNQFLKKWTSETLVDLMKKNKDYNEFKIDLSKKSEMLIANWLIQLFKLEYKERDNLFKEVSKKLYTSRGFDIKFDGNVYKFVVDIKLYSPLQKKDNYAPQKIKLLKNSIDNLLKEKKEFRSKDYYKFLCINCFNEKEKRSFNNFFVDQAMQEKSVVVKIDELSKPEELDKNKVNIILIDHRMVLKYE